MSPDFNVEYKGRRIRIKTKEEREGMLRLRKAWRLLIPTRKCKHARQLFVDLDKSELLDDGVELHELVGRNRKIGQQHTKKGLYDVFKITENAVYEILDGDGNLITYKEITGRDWFGWVKLDSIKKNWIWWTCGVVIIGLIIFFYWKGSSVGGDDDKLEFGGMATPEEE